ncbi:hypothetical protein LTR62_003846 [Meristemomyces frigidus]|uniref:RRM domain-containing protein n=1 Tax=Meristemomyces frigidus TaxID=1508187 RepID=A0AAN7YGJ1_9PEZI|nr:hypothetical protein LTR62_003846 [Meristemomyces frigidus]
MDKYGLRHSYPDSPGQLTQGSEWVHDRYEDDKYDRMNQRPVDDERFGGSNQAAPGTKLKVDNIHYDITEDDLRGLFARKGRILSLKLLYDRADRSTGTAWVIYSDARDARDAVEDYDGQNAQGQPIRVSIVPTGPADRGPPRGAPNGPSGVGARGGVEERSLFDRMQPRERSMFERIEGGAAVEDRDFNGRRNGDRRRERSDSPRKPRAERVENIDRYIPGRGSRSPIRRRGTPRDGGREFGRRPGARREEGGRGGRRGGRAGDGEPAARGGPRPRKTAQELDAEMEDYFGKDKGDEESDEGGAAQQANGDSNGAFTSNGATTAPAATAGEAEDTDMIL